MTGEQTTMKKTLTILARGTICFLLLLFLPLLLSGCSMDEDLTKRAAEKANDALEAAGGIVKNTIDELHNAEYQGGPFENNLESARAYLLTQLQDKYGIEFMIVGDENLENYGAFAGATYGCKVAPVEAPEQVTKAFVSQTMYQDVRDSYAVYFFKEAAEAPALQLCAETEYVQSCEISLRMPQTAKTWNVDDNISNFLQTSGAYLDMRVYFDAGKSDEEYAEMILDFLKKIYGLNANVTLSILEGENDYIFWEKLNVLAETQPQLPAKEEILEDIEIARMMM